MAATIPPLCLSSLTFTLSQAYHSSSPPPSVPLRAARAAGRGTAPPRAVAAAIQFIRGSSLLRLPWGHCPPCSLLACTPHVSLVHLSPNHLAARTLGHLRQAGVPPSRLRHLPAENCSPQLIPGFPTPPHFVAFFVTMTSPP